MSQLTPALQKLEEDRKFVTDNDWMIRPCGIYDAEYSECKAFKSRFYQYYRDGELADCNEWYVNNKDCKLYTKRNDYAAGVRVIKSEMKRLDNRIKAHENNDVWKRRQKRPPPNWTAPLPPHLEQKRAESYLNGREEDMRATIEISSRRCVIS